MEGGHRGRRGGRQHRIPARQRRPGLADPAYNPYVIAVGGYDTMGTAPRPTTPSATYSASVGLRLRALQAPGLRRGRIAPAGPARPGQLRRREHPEGRLGDRYFRGSGTTEAAAITSGAIALMLQKYPKMTPGPGEEFIRTERRQAVAASTPAQGAGELNLAALADRLAVERTRSSSTSVDRARARSRRRAAPTT